MFNNRLLQSPVGGLSKVFGANKILSRLKPCWAQTKTRMMLYKLLDVPVSCAAEREVLYFSASVGWTGEGW